MFRHFIITRFNLRIDSWKFTKSGKEVLTNDWLEERFYLFENYCLPSVKNQKNQNFIWCIYFDLNTPVLYRERIKKIADVYTNISIFFINGFAELNNSSSAFIKQKNTADVRYIITTRLDNDDMLHKDFISTVQSLFLPIDKFVIDLSKGFQLSIEDKFSIVRNYSNRFNPFVSVVEEIDNFKSVFSRQHFEWAKVEKKMEYKAERLWCEVIHHSNKLNIVNNALPKKKYFNTRDFGLGKKTIQLESVLSILVYNFRLRYKFFLRRYFLI